MTRGLALAGVFTFLFQHVPALAADLQSTTPSGHRAVESVPVGRVLQVYRGRATVVDGRTLWFPQAAVKVRLTEIDACELPQWAFDPTWRDRDRIRAPAPIPCGPLAKAWLKRTVGTREVRCRVDAHDNDGVARARCRAGGKDIALEMIRVGWARVQTSFPADPVYLSLQRYAMAARYGMWATYLLDMNEWRDKAVDATLSRKPIADFNLLAERQSEISPPFADARNKPVRADR